VPFLWFDQETEEAVNFYVSIFNGSPHKVRDSGIISITRYEKGMEVPGGDQQVWPRQVCMIFRVACYRSAST
jgi:predicted 3-demethylubiquinone-9 3-methyltransferase (glyoxalase superfamily)